MAIALRGSAEAADTSGTCIINVPAGTVNGDVMYAFLITDSAITDHASWTKLNKADLWAGTGAYGLYRRVASGEPASYSFVCGAGGADAYGIIVSFSGVNTTTPEDVACSTYASIQSLNPVAKSVTTATAAAVVLCFWGHRTAAAITQPAGITFLDDGKGGSVIYSAGYFTQASPGATGDKTATTASNHAICGYQIAMRPSASGALLHTILEHARVDIM